MALVPGWAVVLFIIPPGDEVALGETVRRALSASSTPRMVFGGGDTRRRFARKVSYWTRAVCGLFLASLAAWPLRQPGAGRLSSSLVPPQDRENCHVGGNVFVFFDGFMPRPSNMCEVSSAGARQRTRGCSPRGLGGEFVLVQGL